ncbi:PapD-like protein [Catenaria anguillulae PL171]|uniref:PapD-like protein n=1 Tax=Catenaria anguillulae PL171 TaxID=765915 RepID=A0A1Y2HV16_9FUNG|nr:PapD-like protein [Catenaria anguillulae PL171]
MYPQYLAFSSHNHPLHTANAMSVQLSPPSQLTFSPSGSLAQNPIVPLSIRNVSGSPIAFKIKTTAPLAFTVRPSLGLVDKGKSVEVWIRRRVQDAGVESATCQEKIMVQTVALDKVEGERIGDAEEEAAVASKVANFWESVNEDRIIQHKLHCVSPASTATVELSPPTLLTFPRPLSASPTIPLTIRNTCQASTPIAFKIKTTASKTYTVRPNYGIIHPGKSIQVSIRRLVRSSDTEPAAAEACKDKFMVQVVVLSEDEADRMAMASGQDEMAGKLSEFWQSVGKDRIVEYKLRCAYGPLQDVSLGERLTLWFGRMCGATKKPSKAKKSGLGKDGYYKHVPQS